jgi:hypothetical protein
MNITESINFKKMIEKMKLEMLSFIMKHFDKYENILVKQTLMVKIMKSIK